MKNGACKNILVAIGELPDDVVVLDKAARIAMENNSALNIVHVTKTATFDATGYAYTDINRYVDKTPERLQNVLREYKDSININVEIVDEHEDVVKVIVDKSEDKDLLVMGHHKASPLRHFFTHTHDEEVINKAEVDTLVVHTN